MDSATGTVSTVTLLTNLIVNTIKMVLPESLLPGKLIPVMSLLVGIGLMVAMARSEGKPILSSVIQGLISGGGSIGLHEMMKSGSTTANPS